MSGTMRPLSSGATQSDIITRVNHAINSIESLDRHLLRLCRSDDGDIRMIKRNTYIAVATLIVIIAILLIQKTEFVQSSTIIIICMTAILAYIAHNVLIYMGVFDWSVGCDGPKPVK